MRRTLRLARLLPLLAAAAGPASASTTTGNLALSVEVIATCKVGAASLGFGTYGAGQTADLRAQGSIAYEGCGTSQIKVELDGGTSRNTSARTLVGSGGSKLAYQLYRDSARSKVWGTGSNALTFSPSSGTGSLVVYGSIPGGQSVPVGRYTDTVLVTIDF
jgi:spore coat protein U-like protein